MLFSKPGSRLPYHSFVVTLFIISDVSVSRGQVVEPLVQNSLPSRASSRSITKPFNVFLRSRNSVTFSTALSVSSVAVMKTQQIDQLIGARTDGCGWE